jgi:AcrR family transcriptional regulator
MRDASVSPLAFAHTMQTQRKAVASTPRKKPLQERSRHTVESILEATSQVLMARGYEGTTTGAVVERAGVSIGTLYQYFPNKESLVAALIERHVQEVLSTVEEALNSHSDGTLDAVLLGVIRASLDAHRLAPELHKVLVEQVPREGKLGKALDISMHLSALIQVHFGRRLPSLSPSRLRLLAFVVETTIEALTHRAVIENPWWLSSGELEAEAVRLLRPYLEGAAAGEVVAVSEAARETSGGSAAQPLSAKKRAAQSR